MPSVPHTFRLTHDEARRRAIATVSAAPKGYVVTVAEPNRTLDQNALMWAKLTDISHAKPRGLKKTPDQWKHVIMHACKFECQFEIGLDDKPFPVGLSTSKLNKKEFSLLIDYIDWFASEENIQWSDNTKEKLRAA